MGIVHHAAYLTYFEVGRVEWLRRRGIAYADWSAKGVHLPVVEAHATYQSPARFDDVLTVETTLDMLRAVTLRFAYRVRRGDTAIAEGYTRLACIDAKHKPFKIPDDMRAVLLAAETCEIS